MTYIKYIITTEAVDKTLCFNATNTVASTKSHNSCFFPLLVSQQPPNRQAPGFFFSPPLDTCKQRLPCGFSIPRLCAKLSEWQKEKTSSSPHSEELWLCLRAAGADPRWPSGPPGSCSTHPLAPSSWQSSAAVGWCFHPAERGRFGQKVPTHRCSRRRVL